MPPKTQAAPEDKVMLLTPEQFLLATKPKSIKVASAVQYIDNGSQSWQLPQSGLGHCLYVTIQGSVTVSATVSSGTLRNYPQPAPFGLIRRMRFGSNNSFNMRDLTGWGWYKWIRYRYGVDILNTDAVVAFSPNTTAALGLTGATRMVPGANIAATTYQVNLMLPIPISYNEAGETGLVVLQQNSTFFTLSIDWGQVTGGISATGGSNDIFNTLVGTTLVVTANITTTIGLQYFDYVFGSEGLTSMFMSVNEQIQTPINTGDNVVKPPVNDYYTMFLLEVINNGAPVAVANIQNLVFQHSGNVYDYLDDYLTVLNSSYFQHRLPPMDGVIDWDLGLRRAVIGRRDTLDAFNDMYVTDLQLRFTIPGTLTITGVNQTTLTMESLRYIRQ